MKCLALLLLSIFVTGCATWDWSTRPNMAALNAQRFGDSSTDKWAEKRRLANPEMAEKFKNVVPDDTAIVDVYDKNGNKINTLLVR